MGRDVVAREQLGGMRIERLPAAGLEPCARLNHLGQSRKARTIVRECARTELFALKRDSLGGEEHPLKRHRTPLYHHPLRMSMFVGSACETLQHYHLM